MKPTTPHLISVCLLVSFASAADNPAPSHAWQATGTKGAIVAGHHEAVAAGMQILKAGGNAADATVATILALSVG